MDIRFDRLESLHWLWLVLAVVVVIAAGFRLKRRDALRFAAASMLPRLMPDASRARQYLRATLVVAAMTLVVAAMLDPRWGIIFRQVRQRGVDIVVVLDVSRSMLAEDVRPNRLGRARQYIGDLLDHLSGDRVALVTFAGTAALKCPLTVDYGALRLGLDNVSPDTVPRGGSLLGDALRMAVGAFTDEVPDHKLIIVFTDGEDHGSYPLEAARGLAEEHGVPIYTVGIGDSTDGARIPVEVDGQRVYLTYEGQEVWSKMDPGMLRDIALASGGAFLPVGTGTVEMGRIYEDRMEPAAKREFDTATVRRRHPRHQWFTGLALALLLVEAFIGNRRAAPSPHLREVT